MKRGMEALQIITGLVIALVVIILIIAALTGRFQSLQKIDSCTGRGGNCQITPCSGDKPLTLYTNDCKDGERRCCISGAS